MREEKSTSTKRSVDPSLFGVIIEFNSIYCGEHLANIQIPEKCVVLGCLRNEEVIPIRENPLIKIGDHILAMALHPMMVPELKFVLKKTCPVYYSLNDCPLEH